MKALHLLFVLLLVIALGLAGCQKDPSTSDLRDEYLVYTAYDTKAEFNQIDTYYIPDSILLIGSNVVDSQGNNTSKYWSDDDALSLVNTVVAALSERGFERITTVDRSEADAGLQLSYVEQTSYYAGYNDPYWWGYYPYYWAPSYWGSWWGGWYYPFVTYYSYTTGSLLIEMVDLEESGRADNKLPVLWNAFLSGLLRGEGRIDINASVEAINQAFAQSPYLTNINR